MRDYIYLGSPYSTSDDHVRIRRFEIVCNVAGRLFKEKGQRLFCPIAQSHPMAEYGGDTNTGWLNWLQMDIDALVACTELWIADINGWKESRGVRGEIMAMACLNRPIKIVDTETLETKVLTWEDIHNLYPDEYTEEDLVARKYARRAAHQLEVCCK